MEIYELTEAETRLARFVEEGRICELTCEPNASIRAEVIRRLLLGEPVKLVQEERPRIVPLSSRGLHVEGACIDGELDLEDGRTAEGQALCAVALERCVVPMPLKLSRARLRGLSLRHSKITRLIAGDLLLEGSLNISGLSSAEKEDSRTGADGKGLCWLELPRVTIEGDVDASSSTLVAPPRRETLTDRSSTKRRYALDLRSSHIRDHLFAERLTAIGGISICDAKIGGDVEVSGCNLLAVEGDGFNGPAAQIGGYLLLRAYKPDNGPESPFNIEGSLRLYGTKIDGDLDLRDGRIAGDALFGQAVVRRTFIIENIKIKRSNQRRFPRSRKDRVMAIVLRFFKYVFWPIDRVRQGDPLVSMADAEVASLDDDGGHGFIGRYWLAVDGFEYRKLKLTKKVSFLTMLLTFAKFMLFWLLCGWLLHIFAAWFANLPSQLLSFLELHLRIHFPEKVAGWLGTGAYWAAWLSIACLCGSQIHIFKPQWLERRRWLKKQFSSYLTSMNTEEYDPSPYEHLTRVFRNQGMFEDARKIASHRLTLERKMCTPLQYRPVLWLYAQCFDYGLSSLRALATFSLCILLGAAAVDIADKGLDPHAANPPFHVRLLKAAISNLPLSKPLLVVNSSAVNAVVVTNEATKQSQPAVVRASTQSATTDEMLCGDRIEPLLYALDVFVPALDLQQESRCTISTRSDAYWWRVGKALYSILGWVVVSLTILTISGILRRQAEA